MTRINVVPVEELSQKHLVAEYRELPRIFGAVRTVLAKGMTPHDTRQDPDAYRLGKGHMKFFYNRLTFLAKRQSALVEEMVRRGFKPTFTDDLRKVHHDIPSVWWNDYVPTPEALTINRARMKERTK